MMLGGAAQVAVAHCPNERTLDPAVCSQTQTHMPQPAALWPSPHNVLWQRLTIFKRVLPDTLIYLPRRDGRLIWPEHHECK